ncbi:OmpA family protein [Vulcaniibacterium tengchongense]|uniref:OOP family OmpA-OmpF porin n=1 Tax=Vulcaniibacterium tengchongense TaxID=1273429 RepID=A0A3N4W2E8_9GAMM|nr:OmpA family protein [Vulcaniibacterium tengchongense]RPE80250.1 OOP family OmpA-OmpF porin [Vulcaniibacterium tengchongense]
MLRSAFRNTSRLRLLPAVLLALAAASAQAQTAAPPAPKPVIASGTVPDEATKAAVVARLRELYGAERVVDRIEVDANVVAPPNWRRHVTTMLTPSLQQVSGGRVDISGNSVRIAGEVANEAQRQQVVSDMVTALNNPTYGFTNALRSGGAKQKVLDAALANRIIEFESGSATLTPRGQAILDEMAAAMRQIGNARVLIVGHTDAVGRREANIELSMARAMAVRAYLERQGISPGNLSVQGLGPDQPVADNATPEGRARNRRIEFRVL